MCPHQSQSHLRMISCLENYGTAAILLRQWMKPWRRHQNLGTTCSEQVNQSISSIKQQYHSAKHDGQHHANHHISKEHGTMETEMKSVEGSDIFHWLIHWKQWKVNCTKLDAGGKYRGKRGRKMPGHTGNTTQFLKSWFGFTDCL